MRFDVVTFGSAVFDTFVYTDVSTKGGELHYPLGAKLLVKELRFDVGGGATNTAVAFARLGLKTGCIAAVGDDNNGKSILELLRTEKITFLGPVKRGGQSGYSVILDSHDKDRTILTFKGVNNEIMPRDIKQFDTQWLYCSSIMKTSFTTQKKLIMELAKKGTKIAYNPSSYHIKGEDMQEILKVVSVLILNKEEAVMLQEKYQKSGNTLKALASLGPATIIITDKDNPVQCVHEGKIYTLKPNKKVKVVERTGAGDAFAAGFVAGMIKNKGIEWSLQLGQEESEAVIQHMGAKNNLLKRRL